MKFPEVNSWFLNSKVSYKLKLVVEAVQRQLEETFKQNVISITVG